MRLPLPDLNSVAESNPLVSLLAPSAQIERLGCNLFLNLQRCIFQTKAVLAISSISVSDP